MYSKELFVENFLDEKTLEQIPLRQGFGEALVDEAEKNENVVVLNADLPGSLKLHDFMSKFPKRYIQVGVAEQAMAGLGTGMGLYGKIPFITSFAAFSPGLNWSQIRLAAMSKTNLKVASSHYGVNVGEDGASAQMLADIALMRVLPNFVVLSPADATQTKQAVSAATAHEGPVYLRFTRAKFPMFINPESRFEIGKAQLMKEGKDITIVATGSVVYEAIKTAESLQERGINVELINIHTIKPLDKDTIIKSLQKTGKLAVIEEHYNAGGLASAILEAISSECPVPTLQLGVEDKFGTSGDGYEVMEAYGLHRDTYIKRIVEFLE